MKNTKSFHFAILIIGLLVANPSHSQTVGTTFNSADGKMIYTVTAVGATNSVSVKKKGTPTGKIVIPDTVSYLSTNFKVTGLENSAFSSCPEIDTITIGQNITKIGYGPFLSCTNVKQINYNATDCVDLNGNYNTFSSTISIPCSVNIGAQVKRIPGYLFLYFKNLNSLTFLGNSACTAIGDYAFSNCTNATWTQLTLPDSIQTIGQYAFNNCSGVESLTIGTNLTTIGQYGFYNMNGLDCVHFNASNCSDLTATGIYSAVDTFKVVIGKTVTRIPGRLFYGCTKIDSVLFEESAQCSEVGPFAFCLATALTSISFPNSIITLQPNAFAQCTGLKSIYIPATLLNIKDGAFAVCSGSFDVNASNPNFNSTNGVLYNKDFSVLVQCPNTKEGIFVVPSTVKRIGPFAFAYCTALTSFSMSDEVASIGELAFYSCRGIKSFTFPRAVSKIEPQTFQYCIGLSSITIPEGIVSIGNDAFESCSGLDSISLSKTVRTLGTTCFSRCSKLRQISVPSSVDTLGIQAFGNNSLLSKIIMQDSIPPVMVENSAFKYIASRAKLYVPIGCKKAYVISYGGSFDSGNNIVEASGFYTTQGINFILTDTINRYLTVIENSSLYSGDISIPSKVNFQTKPYTVNAIGNDAFSACSILTSVGIPGTVSSIGNFAFKSCTGLTTVEMPDSVLTVGTSAFQNCTGLITVKLGNSIVSLGDYAFQGCTNLNDINLGKSLENIKTFAFQACTNLASVSIPDSSISIESNAFSDCSNLVSLQLGHNLTNIATLAFQNCSKLESLTLPESISTIGDNAFINCTGLQRVNFNAVNCTSVGSATAMTSNNCFKNCTSLTTVNIGENVTRIPNNIFYRCSGLTTLNGGNNVAIIGDYAFYVCNKLNLTKLPDSLTTLGRNAFSNCTSITSMSLGKKITSIGINAFSNCTSLVTVNFHPIRCTVMGDYYYPAFANCTSFTTLTIDENVTFLPNCAFNSSSKLSTINMLAPNPPTLGSTSVFTNIASGAKLYVPIGSKTNYLSFNNPFTYTSFFSSTGSTTDGSRIIEQAMALNEFKCPELTVIANENHQLIIINPNEFVGYVRVYNKVGQLQLSSVISNSSVTLAKQLVPDLYLVVIQLAGKKSTIKIRVN